MSNDVEATTDSTVPSAIDAAATTDSTTPTECPRCGSDIASQEYYGVCASCTTELRGRYDGSGSGNVEAVEYEPKMNVTPNAVALKE